LVFFLPTVTEEYEEVDIYKMLCEGMDVIANSLQDFGSWGRRVSRPSSIFFYLPSADIFVCKKSWLLSGRQRRNSIHRHPLKHHKPKTFMFLHIRISEKSISRDLSQNWKNVSLDNNAKTSSLSVAKKILQQSPILHQHDSKESSGM